MGKLWRSWKSKLSTQIRKFSESRSTNAERTSQIAKLRPLIVRVEAWDQFVQQRMSAKWIEKSSKMRGIRAKQMHNQTTSRQGYARKEHEYNKEHPDMPLTKPQLWIEGHVSKKKTSESNAAKIEEVKKKMEEATSVDEHDNILTQVLGKDYPGRVRGLGAGVTKSKIYGHTHMHTKYVQMEAQLKDMTEKYVDISEKYTRIEGLLASKFGFNLANDASGKGAPSTSKTNDHCGENVSLDDISPKSGKGSSYHPSINDKCKLVNWNGNKQVVAKGFISAIDPYATVHGAVLGTKCYRIAIEEVLDDSVGFYRYEPEFTNLGDALGSTIAWPISCIVFED